jgi:hypothetical protein
MRNGDNSLSLREKPRNSHSVFGVSVWFISLSNSAFHENMQAAVGDFSCLLAMCRLVWPACMAT